MRRVLMVCVPPVQGVDVIGPLDAFAEASRLLEGRGRQAAYRIELVTNAEDPRIGTSSGVCLLAQGHHRDVRGRIDTLLVAGGPGARACRDMALLAWLARAAVRARRVCSICTGAVLLARAGLLDGRRATTHWRWAAGFAQEHPQVSWDPKPIWVKDGRIYSSAGVSSGMDLALALIEEDFGSGLALDVARQLVLFLRRPGSQAQFSATLAAQATGRRPLQELQVWITENLTGDLSVESLAARSAMSARHFARVFTRELGVTPARYVEQVRIEAARARLTATGDPLEQIASRCGFGSAEVLRRAFLRHLKIGPSQYRRHFQTRAAP